MDTSDPVYEATRRVRQDEDPQPVIDSMVADGFTREAAAEAVALVQRRHRGSGTDAQGHDVAIGALHCVSGIAISLLSYVFASEGFGDDYTVKIGAIVVGALQALYGVYRIVKRR